MLYVILDPNHHYPAAMMEFLNRYERKAIVVFTEENQYHAYKEMFAERLQECVADEYLLPEFPDIKSLATKIIEDLGESKINGIIPWAEFSIETGAALGEALGIDWNPPEVIHRFRHKYALKEFLRGNSDVRINASKIVQDENEAGQFQQSLNKWPIVVKPTQAAGSRNVFFAGDMDSLINYCIEVFQKEGEVLLEEYIGGTEFVVNGITDSNRDILVTDVWRYDKRDSHGMKNLYYETIKVDSYDPVFEPLIVYAGKVIDALGLRKSPFHMELKMDENGPCLIEVGARFAGGNQPLLASRLHSRSLFELAACHYVANLPLSTDDVHYDLYDQHQARLVNGIQTVDIPCVQAIHGMEEVQSLPSFFMIGFVKPVGSYIPLTKDHSGKSYEIYLVHEDPQQIERDASRIREILWYS